MNDVCGEDSLDVATVEHNLGVCVHTIYKKNENSILNSYYNIIIQWQINVMNRYTRM